MSERTQEDLNKIAREMQEKGQELVDNIRAQKDVKRGDNFVSRPATEKSVHDNLTKVEFRPGATNIEDVAEKE